MRVADEVRVPAGAALAVDREQFAAGITEAIEAHPLIRVERGEIPRTAAPRATMSPLIVATGPLTSSALSADDRGVRRPRAPGVLRRDQSDRAGRDDRHGQGVSAVAMGSKSASVPAISEGGQGRYQAPVRRSRMDLRRPPTSVLQNAGDYLNCPFTQGRVRRVSRGHRLRRKSRRARLRLHEVLRGLSADRSDGASRAGDAALRTDEAGRAARSADRAAAVCGRAASPGQPRGRSLQPRRLSDAAQMGRAGARAADDSRSRAGGVRAVRDDPPQHVHQRPDRADARRGRRARGPICSSPDRSRASRATSSRRPPGSSRAAMPRGWRWAWRLWRRRARRRLARSATTCRTPIRGTTIRPTSRSASFRRLRVRRRASRSGSWRRVPARLRISMRGWRRDAGSSFAKTPGVVFGDLVKTTPGVF